MNIKTSYLYQVDDHKRSIILYYIILMVVYLLLITTMATTVSTSVSTNVKVGISTFEETTSSHVQFAGLEFATILFIFIAGCNSFKESFGMLIQNGVSRKSLFISRCFTSFTVAFIMAAIGKVLLLLFKFIAMISTDSLTFSSLYEQLYLNKTVEIGGLQFHAVSFSLDFFMYLGFMALGYLLSVIYYQLSRPGRIALSVSIPVGLFVVLPIIDAGFTHGRISEAIVKFLSFAFGTSSHHPFNAMVTCTLGFLLFSLFSWLLIRRSTVHE